MAQRRDAVALGQHPDDDSTIWLAGNRRADDARPRNVPVQRVVRKLLSVEQ